MNGVELAAFDDLRKALISLPVLQPPNLKIPFTLKCDCSQFCCGAVLTQENDSGREHQLHILQRNCCHETHIFQLLKRNV